MRKDIIVFVMAVALIVSVSESLGGQPIGTKAAPEKSNDTWLQGLVRPARPVRPLALELANGRPSAAIQPTAGGSGGKQDLASAGAADTAIADSPLGLMPIVDMPRRNAPGVRVTTRTWLSDLRLAANDDDPMKSRATDLDEPKPKQGTKVRPVIVVDASILFSSDVDGFKATKTTGFYEKSEEIEGVASFFPTAQGGVSIETEQMLYSVTAGGGAVMNGAFVAPAVVGEVAVQAKINPKVAIGASVGPVYFFEPSWLGDAEVEFTSGAMGIIAGVSLTARVQENTLLRVMLGGVFVDAFDVRGEKGWTVNQSDLDISGFALSVGVSINR